MKRAARQKLLAQIAAIAIALVPFASGASAGVPVEEALKSRLYGISDLVTRPDEQRTLQNFYAARSFAPIWYTENGPTPAAAIILNELADAESFGLDPKDFEFTELALDKSFWLRTAEQTAAADFELSAAILRYARHARGGRIYQPDRLLSDFLDRRPVFAEPFAVLETVASAADPSEALRSFHPKHPQFWKLRELHVKLKLEAKTNQQFAIAAKGALIAPGQLSDEVPILRRRFGVELPEGGDERKYDVKLEAAVQDFQRSVSLNDDGLIGNSTRKALSGSDAEGKFKSIRAAMEQWRWMPLDLGKDHLLVNIPAFNVQVVQNGHVTFVEDVIVGKPETPTPVFSKRMTTIVLRPSWILPDSIKQEKLLAADRRGESIEDQGLVVKKGEKVVQSWSVDWQTADISAYSISQPSGDGNALGHVKFLFPNKHSVYLHDTPNRSLFGDAVRLYSHGCIRLKNPLDFAQKILDADHGPGRLDVAALVDDGPENNEVILDRPLPVHIGYFSVSVGDDGKAVFHGDPYGHDERITLALAHKWDEIDRGPEHNTVPESIPVAAKTKPKAPRPSAPQADDDDEEEEVRKPAVAAKRAAPAPVAEDSPRPPRPAVARTVRPAPARPAYVAQPKPAKNKPQFFASKPSKPSKRGVTTIGEMMNAAYLR